MKYFTPIIFDVWIADPKSLRRNQLENVSRAMNVAGLLRGISRTRAAGHHEEDQGDVVFSVHPALLVSSTHATSIFSEFVLPAVTPEGLFRRSHCVPPAEGQLQLAPTPPNRPPEVRSPSTLGNPLAI